MSTDSSSVPLPKLNIGVTFDLREEYLAQGFSKEETIELDSEVTVAAIEKALIALGHTVERIGNIYKLTTALAAGKKWDFVFNIAEGMFGGSREAQIPALLDAYRIPYAFSEPLTLCVTLDKAMAKIVAGAAGVHTAPHYLVSAPEDIKAIPDEYPLFIKPNAEGSSKGVGPHSFVESRDRLVEGCLGLLERYNPVLVEEYLPGDEYTVGIVGTGDDACALGVMEIVLKSDDAEGYSYHNKINYLTKIQYKLATCAAAEECKKLALMAWRALGCRDGGRIDIKLDKNGRPAFVEVNPLAGLNPDYSDLPILCRLLGMSYGDLIARILNSALKRFTVEIA